jgi:hypothetical protein
MNTRKAITALTALALLIAQSFSLSARAATPDVDLSNEQRSVSGFLGELTKLDDFAGGLKARGRITAIEKARLKSEGEALKRRIAEFQSNIRGAIAKLKAAGLWQNLDQTVAAKIKGGKLRGYLQQEGGAKKLLESVIDRINELRGDIDKNVRDLDALGSRQPINEIGGLAIGSESLFQGRRLVRAGFSPAPASSGGGLFRKVFKCLVSATAFLLASAKNESAGSVQVAENAFEDNC